LSARMRRGVLAGVVAVFAAALIVGNAAAASPNVHRMYVNPQASPAGSPTKTAGSNYGLFTCQLGLEEPLACYDPYQMRRAYGTDSLIANGYDGTGKTIVILDAFDDPYLVGNLTTFDNFYGLPAANLTEVYPAGQANTPYDAGWSQEMQLDVDWAHAIAPGAHLVLVHAKSNNDDDLDAAANYAIAHNLGDVISMSFGESDMCLGAELQNAWHQTFVNATKKGITLFASSGDQGASQPSCDGNSWIKSSSSPASDPLVTGVGGTELHAAKYCFAVLGCDPTSAPPFGTNLGEISWNEGPLGDFFPGWGIDTTESSGGGFSTVWSEPAYQQGTIHGGRTRAVPDVAYNAAILHGVLVYLDEFGGWYLFGGTSSGSPQWAALTAIADQAAGHDYGFINSALYKTAQNSATYASAFNDVTSGNNSAQELDNNNNVVNISGFNAGTGWDAVTGLGTPKAGGLLSELAANWSAGQGTAAIYNSKNG
jgi:subtilase family serine protease